MLLNADDIKREADDRINVLVAQRNQFADQCVLALAEAASLKRRITYLEEKVKALEAGS